MAAKRDPLKNVKTGDPVAVALDGLQPMRGTYRGTTDKPGVVSVMISCVGTGRICPLGYDHGAGNLIPRAHIVRIKADKVAPERLPVPIKTFEEIFGTED